jgi:hypothetical protein
MTLLAPPPATQAVVVALASLADCVCNELAETGAGPTCWCGLYPGATVSWEYCGECNSGRCGMGYVRLAAAFPYTTFPVQQIDTRCASPLGWAVEVGALRCLPQPESGELLDVDGMAEIAIAQVLDASALHRAIKCCGVEAAVEVYQPLGPTGGCVGGLWRAYLAV